MLITGFAPSAIASELRHEAFYSPALVRDMPYVIYLPTGYDQSRSRYPVVYLLHGAGGDENAWSQNGHILGTTSTVWWLPVRSRRPS